MDFIHLLAHLLANLMFHLQDFHFPGQYSIEFFQTFLDINSGQKFLTCFHLEVQMAGNQIREPSGIINDGHGNQRLGRNLLGQAHPFFKLMHYSPVECLHIHRRIDFIGKFFYLCGIKIFLFMILMNDGTVLAFHQYPHGIAR